jgi:hypothetical protein
MCVTQTCADAVCQRPDTPAAAVGLLLLLLQQLLLLLLGMCVQVP